MCHSLQPLSRIGPALQSWTAVTAGTAVTATLISATLISHFRRDRRAGSFNNPCGRLRSLGLVDYPEPGYVKAEPVLFLGQTGGVPLR